MWYFFDCLNIGRIRDFNESAFVHIDIRFNWYFNQNSLIEFYSF